MNLDQPETEQARQATTRAGVEVRLLSALADLEAIYALFDGIWKPDKSNPPVTVQQLRAMTHAGNYAAGAYQGGELVGACVGFFAAPPGVGLHSHVTGVARRVRGQGVAFALKLHQRAWALRHGLSEVTWTFDPLVRRNAHFNLAKLAARPREYLVDFYGDVTDAINAGQGSDRLLVAWDLTAPAVVAACAGTPPQPDPAVVAGAVPALVEGRSGRPRVAPESRWRPAERVLVAVPEAIESLRRTDPETALAWRTAVRDLLGGMVATGARVVGFTRTGSYLVERNAS